MKKYCPLVSHHLRVIERHLWSTGLVSASVPRVFEEGQIDTKISDLDIKQGYGGAWIRDNAYVALGPLYAGEMAQAKLQLYGLLDIFHAHVGKLRNGEGVHAKVDPRDLSEITPNWGHRQHDAIGITLWVVAEFYSKDRHILRVGDIEVIQSMIDYLGRIEYWHMPDFGMWEECEIRHSSSIGSVVGGLKHIQKQNIEGLHVSEYFIVKGEEALREILPKESKDLCWHGNHYHCCDSAQLFLIWPHAVLTREQEDDILQRILKGHSLWNSGKYHHKLNKRFGLQRYWGDGYGMTEDWHSVQWQWHPLVSIIFAQRKEYKKAYKWFRMGMKHMIPDGCIAEFRTGKGDVGEHTPLVWMHALYIKAFLALPRFYQDKILEIA
jgi:phosphorylase kinase alpha/beta subunit